MHHVFGYLNKHHNTELVFGPSSPDIDMNAFDHREWTTSKFLHRLEEDAKPERPSNMSAPRGIVFTDRGKVDAEHDVDAVTRRSRTGFIEFLNSFPTCWFSRKQNSVESSPFGSKFTAMK